MIEKSVLLTGFQPFGEPRPEINSSWECIKTLENVVLKTNRCEEVRIRVCELPVEYEPILDIIPTLHSSENPHEYYIHVGQGRPGAIQVETLAHRAGYCRLDNTKCAPKDGKCPRYSLESISTLVDVEKLVEDLSSAKEYKIISSSCAGRYLCEFTYYCSMAESLQSLEKHGNPRKKVLFVHVPSVGCPYTLSELTEIIKKIVIHVVSNN